MKTTASRFRKNWFLQGLITILMMPGLVIFPVALQANPSGASVVAGSISFDGLNTSSLTINQATQNGIINWNDFSIGAGELTQFVQPNASALTINRVTGGNPSAIYGQLRANGNIMVINTNGILVGASGVIDVKGAVTLSTLDAANHDLLNGGSTLFSGAGTAGVTNYGLISGRDVIFMGNTINNYGQVTAARAIAMGAGGEILLGQTQDGATISVRGGGAGADTGINNSGTIAGGNVFLEGHGNTYNRAINNSGTVRATGFNYRGGRLTLSGGSGSRIINTGNMYARQQNGAGGQIAVTGSRVDIDSGTVDASGSTGMDGGSIDIQAEDISFGADALMIADGAEGGSINVDASNSLTVGGNASSTGEFGQGGSVAMTGDLVEVEATAIVDVSGLSGGSAKFGGGFQGSDPSIRNASNLNVEEGALVIADGTLGDGGEVIFWADYDTAFRGEVSAQARGIVGNGGFVEVSGKETLTFRGLVSTQSLNGRTGTLLLDPTDVTIVSGAAAGSSGATFTDTDLNAALASNNVVIHTGTPGGDDGNILVDNGARIEWGTPNTDPGAAGNFTDLTLIANTDIIVNGHIISHGAGNVNLFAGWDGVTNLAGLGVDPGLGLPNAYVQTDNIDFNALREFGTPTAGVGTVYINTAGNDQAVQVGSRFGETNVIASDLILEVPVGGSDRFAHLGYRATTNWQSGGAGVYGLVSQSDFRYSDASKSGINNAQIDLRATLGADTRFNADTSGDINVEVEKNVLLKGETINDTRKYTMIGHGGNANVRDNDLYTGGNANAIDYSLINADHSGNIRVIAGRGAEGLISLQGGRETGFSRIGHGGLSNPANAAIARGAGAFKGEITVINQNGSIVATGNDANSGGWAGYVQIGHGGYRNSRTTEVTEGVNTGNTDVRDHDNDGDRNEDAINTNFDTALGSRALDPDMVTPDGNAVGDQGNIYVEAVNGIVRFQAGNSSRSSARIGHGGHERPGNIGSFNADGTVNEGADITVIGDSVLFKNTFDNDDQRMVQIGHGGYMSPGNAAGNIYVESKVGNVEFEAGANYGYAMVGHGGHVHTWNTDQQGVAGTLSGDVSVSSAQDIIFGGGTRANYIVTRAFKQIGHGGFGWVSQSRNADPLMNGHHGDISVTAGGEIDFKTSVVGQMGNYQSHAMIGHGGYAARGNHYGKIDVNAETGITFEAFGGWDIRDNAFGADSAGGNQNFAMIGHGGHDTDHTTGAHVGGELPVELGGVTGSARDSSINVNTASGDIIFIAPQLARVEATRAEAEAGGGQFTDNGDEDLTLLSAYAEDSFVKIGHGGTAGGRFYNYTDGVGYTTGGISGDIAVSADAGKIEFVASDIKQEYVDETSLPYELARANVFGDRFRDTFDSRRSYYNFSQIGHGGEAQRGTKNGTITVTSEGDIIMKAGDGSIDFAMIGHGGWDSDAPTQDSTDANNNPQTHVAVLATGDIEVRSNAGSVIMWAGMGDDTFNVADLSWAQIGHGGRSSNGSVDDASITVYAGGGDVELIAGMSVRENFALIGHGGRDSRAQRWGGDIDVYAQNNITMIGRMNGYDQGNAFSQIGHGGFDTDIQGNNNDLYNIGSSITGQIDVVAATGDIIMLAGQTWDSAHANNVPLRYEGSTAPNTGWQGDATNPALEGPTFATDPNDVSPSDGYIFARRGNLTERPLDGTDGNTSVDGTDNVTQQGGWVRIGHGGQHTNITVLDQDINVTAGASVIGVAGEVRDAMVQVGHGGGPDSWNGNRARRRTVATGDIDITAGNNMLMYAGSGNNASVKIGMGEYQPTSDRSRVEGGTDAQGRSTTWGGDIEVKVGNNIILDADDQDDLVGTFAQLSPLLGTADLNTLALQDPVIGNTDFNRVLIGHLDSNDNRAGHRNGTILNNSFGDTFIAVSRNNPDYLGGGSGYFETRVSADNPNGVVLSSGNNGFGGDLRVYIPNRVDINNNPINKIATGTIFNNNSGYVNPSSTAVSLEGPTLARGDENLNYFEFTLDSSNGYPEGEFDPEGPYFPINGLGDFYQIYYNNFAPPVDPGVGPQPVDLTPLVDAFGPEVYDWAYGLLTWDGYESNGLWDNLGSGDAIDDGSVPRSGLEQMLDGAFGPRTSGGGSSASGSDAGDDGTSNGFNSDSEQERIEEQERIQNFRMKQVGKGQNQYYIYSPASGTYSSLRMFGVPISDLPAFSQ